MHLLKIQLFLHLNVRLNYHFFHGIFTAQINFDKRPGIPYYTRFNFTPWGGEKKIESMDTSLHGLFCYIWVFDQNEN